MQYQCVCLSYREKMQSQQHPTLPKVISSLHCILHYIHCVHKSLVLVSDFLSVCAYVCWFMSVSMLVIYYQMHQHTHRNSPLKYHYIWKNGMIQSASNPQNFVLLLYMCCVFVQWWHRGRGRQTFVQKLESACECHKSA